MALSFTILSLALLMFRCLSSISGENQEQFTFAKCEPNREECRDCYFALVQSLLGRADNVFNLTNAFSPPGKHEPEYVIVMYLFHNSTLSEKRNWFWSKSVAYYLFPMDVLQLLSFFLSKNLRYQRHVRVTLNATECWGANNDYMTLLTQKLHIYARAQSITPHLDNSYTSLAVNNETFDNIVGTDLISIIMVCPIVVMVLAFIIIVMLLVVYTRRDQWKKRLPLTRSSKATLLSLAAINQNYVFAVFVVDLYTVINREREQSYPINGQGKIGEPCNILYNIPVVVFVFDLLAIIPIVFTTIRPICSYVVSGNLNDIADNQCYKLALSTIGVIISLLNHSPYMVMAYFIDPYYTTGVLLFYTLIVISWFSLLEFIFDSLLRKPQTTGTMFTRSNRHKRVCAHYILLSVLSLSYMGLAYAVLLYLLVIPIKPVFIAIGSFAVYKLVSRRKRLWNHENSIPETEEYEALRQDRPQDTEQQPLLGPHDQ